MSEEKLKADVINGFLGFHFPDKNIVKRSIDIFHKNLSVSLNKDMQGNAFFYTLRRNECIADTHL